MTELNLKQITQIHFLYLEIENLQVKHYLQFYIFRNVSLDLNKYILFLRMEVSSTEFIDQELNTFSAFKDKSLE